MTNYEYQIKMHSRALTWLKLARAAFNEETRSRCLARYAEALKRIIEAPLEMTGDKINEAGSIDFENHSSIVFPIS